MHKSLKRIKLIVMMLICILLLFSNFVIVFADEELFFNDYYVDGDISNKFATQKLMFAVPKFNIENIEEKGNTSIIKFKYVNYDNFQLYPNDWKIYIRPKETGVYSISLLANNSYSNKPTHLMYELKNYTNIDMREADRMHRMVRLAAVGIGNYKENYTVLSLIESKDNTTIDVILDKDYTYVFEVDHYTTKYEINKEYSAVLEIKKRNIGSQAMALTNIGSSVKSLRYSENYDYDKLEVYAPPKYKIFEYTDLEINNLKNIEPEKSGGALEAIIVDVLLAIGTGILSVIEWSLGLSESLTIDNILFNRIEELVIDLTPIGGIDLSISNTATGKGIFYNEVVLDIVSTLFNSLKSLAIMIYIVMLLVIGIKILLSVGGKDQSKYLKYLEYWISGIIILVVFPYFLPALPVMSNSIIALMETEAKSINSNYTTEEILARLDYDASLLGEDAEVVQYQEAIDEKIAELDDLITNTPETRAEAQANIDAGIQEAISKFHDLSDDEKAELEEKINAVKLIIDENYDKWDLAQDNYEKALSDVREYMLVNQEHILNDILDKLPSNVKNDTVVYEIIEDIVRTIQRDPKLEYSGSTYSGFFTILSSTMSSRGLGHKITEVIGVINDAKDKYIDYTNTEAFTNLEGLFENYKNAVIQEEIEVLRDMKESLSSDIMFTLKSKAQRYNRVVYAIAWIILMYQMFAILFMYYRRIIGIIILIVIFPIIMAFYVIDKIGDGKSQSLTTWVKEFLATLLVQILHASVYVIVINIGIDACTENPSQNWIFLMLSVCLLFPAERLLRGIIGLGGSSTLGELKNNIGGLVMGAYATTKLVKKGYKTVKNVKNVGSKGSSSDAKKKAKLEEEEKKKKKKADLERSKARNREYRNMLKNERVGASDARIRSHASLTTYDRARIMGGKVKSKISNLENNPSSKTGRVIKGFKKYGKAGIEKATKYGEKATKYGKATINRVKTVGKAGLKGAKFIGKGYNFAKKAVGVTMGALEGMENFSQGGALSALATATSVAKNYGVFGKDEKGTENKKKQSSSTAARFRSKYSNGVKISGNRAANIGSNGGFGMSGGNSSSTTTSDYARVRTTYNYNEPVIIDNTQDEENAARARNNNETNNS